MEAEPAATEGGAFIGTAPPGPPEAVALDGALAGGVFTGIPFAGTFAEADLSASERAAGAAEAAAETDHSASEISSRAAEAAAEADPSASEKAAASRCNFL